MNKNNIYNPKLNDVYESWKQAKQEYIERMKDWLGADEMVIDIINRNKAIDSCIEFIYDLKENSNHLISALFEYIETSQKKGVLTKELLKDTKTTIQNILNITLYSEDLEKLGHELYLMKDFIEEKEKRKITIDELLNTNE